MGMVLDKAKISQRIDRFGKQGVMNESKKKLSIDDLLKSVVSLLLGSLLVCCCCTPLV